MPRHETLVNHLRGIKDCLTRASYTTGRGLLNEPDGPRAFLLYKPCTEELRDRITQLNEAMRQRDSARWLPVPSTGYDIEYHVYLLLKELEGEVGYDSHGSIKRARLVCPPEEYAAHFQTVIDVLIIFQQAREGQLKLADVPGHPAAFVKVQPKKKRGRSKQSDKLTRKKRDSAGRNAIRMPTL